MTGHMTFATNSQHTQIEKLPSSGPTTTPPSDPIGTLSAFGIYDCEKSIAYKEFVSVTSGIQGRVVAIGYLSGVQNDKVVTLHCLLHKVQRLQFDYL